MSYSPIPVIVHHTHMHLCTCHFVKYLSLSFVCMLALTSMFLSIHRLLYNFLKKRSLSIVVMVIHSGRFWGTWVFLYSGWPRKKWNSRFFRTLLYSTVIFSPCWIEHPFPIIITPRSSNLVENFLFYETFLMDCHFRDLPNFQSFKARWQINGKSQKWQSIRNYS